MSELLNRLRHGLVPAVPVPFRGAEIDAPAQRRRSRSLTRNTPGRPDVPDDRPTVTPATVGVKSRVRSASRATLSAWSRVTPYRLKPAKSANTVVLSTTGSSASGRPAYDA